MPNDSQLASWHNLSMPKDATPSEFNARLVARVKELREGKRHSDGKGWTAEDMAVALGIPAERYRKYESRTPIPHELMPRFALVTGASVEYLLTGSRPVKDARHPKPPRPPKPSKSESQRASK